LNAKRFFVLMCAIALLLLSGGYLVPVASSAAAAQEVEAHPGLTAVPRGLLQGAASQPAGAESQDRYPAYYIVFQQRTDDSVDPVAYCQVALSGYSDSLSNEELAGFLRQPDRNAEHLAVTLTSVDGQILYRTGVELPRWLRGEFHGAGKDAPIEGYLFPQEQPAFVVRVPILPGARLTLQDASLQAVGQFDLAQLARTTPEIVLPHSFAPVGLTGDPANRVDFLVLGDGYTASQQAQFNSDAANITSAFFGISPHQEYSNYVNTYALFTASAQSGADHPPYQAICFSSSCCGDSAMLSDPLQGTFVNTAFDATYCTSNIHRLLTVNTAKVLTAAAAVPDWDEILVIVNDSTYGGSGGTFAVASLHASAPQLAQHEYGHSFAGLADEYESAYPGYPLCSDVGGPGGACEPNVTDATTRGQIKWNPWISDSTPIPTSETDPAYATVVGLFEGARYRATGMYRSGQNCLMRALNAPYCQVPSQTYVLRLYNGGWGVPSSGIELIEPGSVSPAAAIVFLPAAGSQVFHASILQPAGGPPVSIQWSVDGVVDPAAHTDTFTYTAPIQAGSTVEIRLSVTDVTGLVNPSMAGNALQSSHTWTVVVGDAKQVWLPFVALGQ
jgi:hypothetical protein